MCEREKYEKAKLKCDITCCIVMCLQYIDTEHSKNHPSVVALQMKDSKQRSNIGPIKIHH